MAAGKTYEPIASTTTTTSVTEVIFSSISQSYTDLIVICSGTTSGVSLYMRVGNGTVDSGSNYSVTRFIGNGSATSSDNLTNNDIWYISTGNFVNAQSIINIQNYSNTTTNKSAIARQNMPASHVNLSAHVWRSTSAINIIRIFVDSGNIGVGSTFTIYGIAAA
jgi:hypothetical protein